MHPDLEEAIAFHESIVAEGGKALIGYETAKALANVVLLSEIPTTYDKNEQRQVNAGNLLLRGVPGVGKTFFGVILAAISDAKFARIQGRADLQPTEVVGFQMINPATGALVTEFGPLASAEVILLDEINRIPLKSQSAFLEGLQDRTVTVGKTTYELPAFSFAIATMNPIELGQGTFPLSEAATDRFAIMVNIGYLAPAEEAKLVNFDFKRVRLNKLMSKERIIQLRGAISQEVFLHERLGIYIQRLVAASRPYNPDTDWLIHSPSELVEHSVDLGASPRAIICWGRLAKVWTLLVQAAHRGLSGGHPGPRAIHPQPPHLARPARREPRADRGRRHQGHPRAGGDSLMKIQSSPTREREQTPLVNLSEITEVELLILKRMREFTIGEHRSLFHGTGLRFRRAPRLGAGRPLLVDRLAAVLAHQLQPAHRPRVRAAEHGQRHGRGRRVAVDAVRRRRRADCRRDRPRHRDHRHVRGVLPGHVRDDDVRGRFRPPVGDPSADRQEPGHSLPGRLPVPPRSAGREARREHQPGDCRVHAQDVAHSGHLGFPVRASPTRCCASSRT